MTSTERAQTWLGMADGEAGGEDERPWRGVVAKMRSVVARDAASLGTEMGLDREIPDDLTGAMDLSDVRLEQVMRLRRAIASGCYKVSASDLADKLMASASGSRGWRATTKQGFPC